MGWLRAHWVPVVVGILGLAVGAAGGAAGKKAKTTTDTVTSATTVTSTATVAARAKTRVVVKTQTVTVTSQASTSAPVTSTPSSGGLSWSGNGGQNMGTITVPQDSTIRWTNDGGLFSILDDENSVEVNSQAHSGQSAISAGTYHHFQVNAVGNWTIQIG
jgi:hypothetical protein